MVDIFTQITALLVLTVGVAWVTKLLRQPMIVAYIFAGIASGPLLFNFINRASPDFEIFSQFGVVLLLFAIGLSLNFNYIKKVGKIAFIASVGQTIFTAVLGFWILTLLHFSTLPAIYIAIAFTFSSTIIVTKLLADAKQTDTFYGRHTIGLMLVQDVIAVILMVLLTANGQSGGIEESILRLLAGGFLLISGVVIMARYALPFILKRIADSTESLFLFSLAWCFLLAYIAKSIGFSFEVGAVAAGIALGSSPYQPEISARIASLRDFFLIIFFIILGAGMDIPVIGSAFLPAIVLTLFILIGNPLILYFIYRGMKFTRKNSLFIGLTSAQVSEFGFVLVYVGGQMGHIGQGEIATFTLVAITTILMSTYMMTYNEAIFRLINPILSMFSKKDYVQVEDKPVIYDIWVVGYHRIGWSIVHAIQEKHSSLAIIDFDPTVIEALKKENIPAYFLDIGDIGLLSELPIDKAKMVISTIPNIENQIGLIKHVRAHSSKTILVVNAPEAKYMRPLYNAGADYVMTPHLLGGKWMGNLISSGKTSREEFQKLRIEQEEEIARGLPVQML